MARQQRLTAQLTQDAQRALERLSLGDIRAALVGAPSHMSQMSERHTDLLFQRAEAARLKDEVLGATVLPSHLYVIDAILNDPHLPVSLIDCVIQALRHIVYVPQAVAC